MSHGQTYWGVLTILHRGKPANDGLFNVEGEPVEPQVSLAVANIDKKNATTFREPVTIIGTKTGRFGVTFWTPGRFTFEASVGKHWSRRVTVDVKKLPFWEGVGASSFVCQFGLPSEKREAPGGWYWAYKKWPGLVLTVGGDSAVAGIHVLPDAQVRKDGLPEWSAPDFLKMSMSRNWTSDRIPPDPTLGRRRK